MKENRNSEEILDAIKMCIPYVKQLVPNDLSVSLFVEGVCQAVTPGDHVNLGLEIGSEMADDPGLVSATQKKCAIHNVLPREVFGMAVEGELVPVLDDDNNVLGILASAYDMEDKFQVEKSSAALSDSMGVIKNTTDKIADATEYLSGLLQNIQAFSTEVISEIEKISKIVSTIQRSSAQSNILALNASIEAARAGAAGRSFTVVAEKMRSFSDESKVSANQIAETLKDMQNAVVNLHDQLSAMQDKYNEQAADIVNIKVSMEEVTKNANELKDLAKK